VASNTTFHLFLQPSFQAVERIFQHLVDMVAAMGFATSVPKIVELNHHFAYVDTYEHEAHADAAQAERVTVVNLPTGRTHFQFRVVKPIRRGLCFDLLNPFIQ
jgi:hypothetical protein